MNSELVVETPAQRQRIQNKIYTGMKRKDQMNRSKYKYMQNRKDKINEVNSVKQ